MPNLARKLEASKEFRIDVFGQFNNVEIRSIVDRYGRYWFTQEVVALALEVDKTTIIHSRQNHASEFTEDVDYMTIVFDGKRRLVYSEDGFFTLCDMANSERAYRLRKWMRQQFRVKHEGEEIVVRPKTLPREDMSDLDDDLALMQEMLNKIAENRRRLLRLERDQQEIETETRELKETVSEHENRLATWEDGAKVKPGEMTAMQLAQHCRWVTSKGGVHNTAVILAAANEGFIEARLMVGRREQGPDGRPVEVQVFTPNGVAEFLSRVDGRYFSGQSFEIEPNETARANTYKCKRYVSKR